MSSSPRALVGPTSVVSALLLTVLSLTAAFVMSASPPALAQAGCASDAEPNDEPASATPLGDAACAVGSLPGEDLQDLYLWQIPQAEGPGFWQLSLRGLPGALTSAQLLPVTSDPSAQPLEVGSRLVTIDVPPDTSDAVISGDLLLPPGAYLLAVYRSAWILEEPPDEQYEVALGRGSALPQTTEAEPNDDVASATPVSGAFTLLADRAGGEDRFAWTLAPLAPETSASIVAQGVPGSVFTLGLESATGALLAATTSDATATARLPDLRPPAGRYAIVVSAGDDDGPDPYVLSAALGPAGAGDLEPNDDPGSALDLPVGTVMSGRLARAGDQDLYRLRVDASATDRLIDIKLLGPAAPWRQLCLSEIESQSVGLTLRCAAGTGPLVLQNLRLPAEEHLVSVRADEASEVPYYLRVDVTSPPAPDFEVEPNDSADLATAMSADVEMRGRVSLGDIDVYRLAVGGELGLWSVDAVGADVTDLAWIRPDGTTLARGAPHPDGTGPGITDMLLIPGEHWFRVTGDEGEYHLRFAALGPPDPAAEREPNDTSMFGEPMMLGERRLGRLTNTLDQDVSRVSLAARERIRIVVQPPADGQVEMGLADAQGWLAWPFSMAPGEAVIYEALLPAGDYEVWLRAVTPSDERYDLRIERLDPFAMVVDEEPNDDPARASEVPASLRVEGSGRPGSDLDWYRLPVLPADGQLTVETSGVSSLRLVEDGVDLPVEMLDEGRWRSGLLLAGSAPLLGVSAVGPYRLSLDPGDTGLIPQVASADPAAAADLRIALDLPETPVAAYWPDGQRLDGRVVLTNAGAADVEALLDTASSHFGFSIEPLEDRIVVPAGSSVDVPALIDIAPDAWADIPVRLTVRATSTNGAWASAYAELTPSRTADPANPTRAWPLPDALLGGLDVASLAVGATVIPAFDPAGEAQLHDGIAPPDGGLGGTPGVWPLELTVDLAGEDAVPIRGTILHPVGRGARPADVPRGFELRLSLDGVDWQTVLAGELAPDGREQAFSLDVPIPARFAQLRILSTWGSGGGVSLGEWKVVAEPGTLVAVSPPGLLGPAVASSQPNIADPALGGHVAWLSPQLFSQAETDALLLEDLAGTSVQVEKGAAPSWAIGFREARSASLDRLEWVDAPGTDPSTVLRRVDVAVSTHGAGGPWRSLGPWKLRRAPDGTIEPFVFPDDTRARYVRLIGEERRRDGWVSLPATIRAFERTTVTEGRSILGEWGMGSRLGPAEWAAALATGGSAGDASSPGSVDAGVDGAASTAAVPLDLTAGTRARGRVHRAVDDDWYRIAVPEGSRSLAVTLYGVPTVAAAVELIAADGLVVPGTSSAGDVPGSVVFSASVTPGTDYRLRVYQPPYSAVFAFDTSISVSAYLPFVYGALRSFTEAVVEGAEAVKLVPFAERPLLEAWSDQPFVLQDAVNRFVSTTSSSSAETALVDALRELALRPGTRAILLITDAETSSFDQSEELWRELARVRPIIHAIQVSSALPEAQHFMQDWAAVGDGHYQYVITHADIDRAFDRMATQLRRPAKYELSYTTSSELPPSPEPGAIQVARLVGEGELDRPLADPDVAVAIILDTSSSMLERLGRQRRIDVAKSVLRELVSEGLRPGTPVSLRVFRQVRKSCDTELAAPLGPLDPEVMLSLIDSLGAIRGIGTPLAAAIEALAEDLGTAPGPRIAVVVSDGQESCGGDPEAAVRSLATRGVDVRLNIVGLDLDRKTRKRIARLAGLGNGTYFDARDPGGLSRAIASAVSPPVQVIASDGTVVATGTLDGETIDVPPGIYRVDVLGDPVRTFDPVLVTSGETARITLTSAHEDPVDRPEPQGVETTHE